LFECSRCLRSVGLWLFKKLKNDNLQTSEEKEKLPINTNKRKLAERVILKFFKIDDLKFKLIM
jgi:hypothetical protein